MFVLRRGPRPSPGCCQQDPAGGPSARSIPFIRQRPLPSAAPRSIFIFDTLSLWYDLIAGIPWCARLGTAIVNTGIVIGGFASIDVANAGKAVTIDQQSGLLSGNVNLSGVAPSGPAPFFMTFEQ